MLDFVCETNIYLPKGNYIIYQNAAETLEPAVHQERAAAISSSDHFLPNGMTMDADWADHLGSMAGRWCQLKYYQETDQPTPLLPPGHIENRMRLIGVADKRPAVMLGGIYHHLLYKNEPAKYV